MNTKITVVPRMLLTAVLLMGGPAGLAAQDVSGRGSAKDSLDGTWEGEFEGPRAPVFVTLHLNRDLTGWTGSIVVLGRTIPVRDVVPNDGGVTVVLTPGRFEIEAERRGDRLVGVFRDGEERLPLALVRVPHYPEPTSRAEAWRQDLDALASRFLRADRSFSPAERTLFLERIEKLRASVEALSDPEIIMRMASAVALSGNAHTRLYLLRNRTELRRLPVRVWWFSDGLYVVRTTAEYRDLLGCRIDAIAGVDARDARDRVAPAYAGNASWTDYMSAYLLTSPEALYGFHITRELESVELQLSQCRARPFRAEVEPLPLVRRQTPVEAWWDLSPAHRDDGWTHALESRGDLPLYLRHPERHYWFEHLPNDDILYVQYNRAAEMPDDPVPAFGERLLAALESLRPRAFVLDLRFNTGGNLDFAKDLMAKLEERTRGIPRFVITGRATFSAGITAAAAWRAAGDVTIVGEPVGDELDFWSEGGNIILPNSGFAAHFANAFHSYSELPCPDDVPCFLDLSAPDLRPDFPASSRWSDYAAGIDVALETIREELARLRCTLPSTGSCIRSRNRRGSATNRRPSSAVRCPNFNSRNFQIVPRR